jgi:hypothetical protein
MALTFKHKYQHINTEAQPHITMAIPKKYPRATIRKSLKAHSLKRVTRDVDAFIYLDYVLFMSELMQAAERKAREGGEKKIAARDLRRVTMGVLRKFKG